MPEWNQKLDVAVYVGTGFKMIVHMCLKERKVSLKFYIHLKKDAEFHIIQVLVVDIITDRVHLVYRVHVLNKNWINLIKHQGSDPSHQNFGVYI